MALLTTMNSFGRPVRRSGLRRTTGAAAVVSALVVVTACGGSSDAASDGDSVAADASKEDFQAALTDMDQVVMKVQVLAPKDTGYAQAWIDYGEALDEWSGDKITFKMHYSGSVVPTDVPGALADGLLDAAPIQPSFEPDTFPISAWVTQRMTLNDNTPVAGTLQQIGSVAQVTMEDEVLTAELEDQDIHPLIPGVVNGLTNIMCGDDSVTTLADLDGKQIRAATQAHEHELTALGATPVSLSTLEVFEGVQRGTVDCTATPNTSAYTMNLAEVAHNWVIDPSVGLAPTAEAIAVSKSTWDDLPLAAQQLMHDRLDVFLTTYFEEHVMGGITKTMQQAADEDVRVEPFQPDARAKLQEYQRTVRERQDAPGGFDGAAFVADLEKRNEEWGVTVDDLGYGEEITWDEFAAVQEKSPTDMKPFVEELVDRVLSGSRPQ